MLKHKIFRRDPQTMSDLLTITEKYATADAAMQKPLRLEGAGQLITALPAKKDIAGPSSTAGQPSQNDRDNNQGGNNRDHRKRGGSLLTNERYDNQLVATAEGGQATGGGGDRYPRQRGDNRPWQKAKYTFEQMLDSPCKYHSAPGKPATHTTQQCSWTTRLTKGEGLPPAPAPNPRGGNNRDDPQGQQPAVPPGVARNNYPRQDGTYVISVIERDDKCSHRSRMAEVNATAPDVP